MKQITLSVPDSEYSFFMKLVKQLDFVKVNEPAVKLAKKQQFLDGLKEAMEEVNLAKKGKIKLKSADQLLSEL